MLTLPSAPVRRWRFSACGPESSRVVSAWRISAVAAALTCAPRAAGRSAAGAVSASAWLANRMIALTIRHGERAVYFCRNHPFGGVPGRDSAGSEVNPTLRACSASSALLMARSYPPGIAAELWQRPMI